LATLAVGLSACGSGNSGPQEGTIGFIPGFIGGAVADEPRAVLAARDILSAGGTAADAAVALYFTLAVTKPAQAGLGGGGVCVVYSWRTKQTESLDFLPAIRPGEGVVPGNPRGMLALQAKYGKLRWEFLIGTAERIARGGTTASRSTARDLAAAAAIIARDPGLKEHFMNSDGTTPAEGTVLAQPELAGTLSVIRRAPQEFYTGPFAHAFSAAAADAGQRITPEAMRAYAPSWGTPVAAPFGTYTMYFAPNQAGTMAAAAWKSLGTEGGYERAASRQGALAAAFPIPPGETPSPETSFVVADRDGNMIGCTVTMNRFFGTGRMARGTGLVPAAPDPSGRIGGLAPMVATNPAVPRPYFVGAASGGAAGTRGMLATALGVFSLGQPLDAAMAAGRPDTTGLVNAIYCLRGINPLGRGEEPEAMCQLAADKRGFGLAQHD
jgi:gamma-glutamyltranspeptidase/glutathione hydrolase